MRRQSGDFDDPYLCLVQLFLLYQSTNAASKSSKFPARETFTEIAISATPKTVNAVDNLLGREQGCWNVENMQRSGGMFSRERIYAHITPVLKLHMHIRSVHFEMEKFVGSAPVHQFLRNDN